MKDKLAKELDLANWTMLHPHFVRNSLYLVDAAADFIDVCAVVAANDVQKVDYFIKENIIRRPDGLQVEEWHKSKPVFKCLVVSPHVFIQETEIVLKKNP